MRSSDIAIIGGGVIGLSIAWRLAAQGATVTVLDSGEPGQATQAAAGMLAPLAECRAPSSLLPLALDSLRRYPDFAAALREQTGMDISLCGPGLLRVARTEDEEDALCRTHSWQRDAGLPLRWLSGDEARVLEPSLCPQVRAAVLSLDERHVPPRRLHRALQAACLQSRVRLLHCTVTEFNCERARVTCVQTAQGRIPCGEVVIAGGAWSAELAARLKAAFPVRPVRGQTVTLRPTVPLRHTLYSPNGYLVPRPDGTVLAGATEEDAGFDARPTAEGVASLLLSAMSLVPALAEAAWDNVRVGLRPVTPDGMPLLGRVPGWENVSVAAGHGRNGILLAPLTADALADWLLRAAPPPPAFSAARFGTTL